MLTRLPWSHNIIIILLLLLFYYYYFIIIILLLLLLLHGPHSLEKSLNFGGCLEKSLIKNP